MSPSAVLTQMRTACPVGSETSPVPQVPQTPLLQGARAGVADADAAAELEVQSGFLAGRENRCAAVAFDVLIAAQKADRAALALLVAAADDGLETLVVELVRIAVLLPPGFQIVQEIRRAGAECLTLTPIGAQLVQIGRLHAAAVLGDANVEVQGGMLAVQSLEGLREHALIPAVHGMDDDDVLHLVQMIELAQHAHDRRDAAAGADVEQLVRHRIGQGEDALDLAESDDVARLDLLHEEGRHGALRDELGADRDEAVVAVRIRGERVGAPVIATVDQHAEAQVLAGLVTAPLVPGLDEHRDGVGSFTFDVVDLPAELPRGPQRIDHLEVVVRPQRVRQMFERLEHSSPEDRHLGACTAFSHGANGTVTAGDRCPNTQ